MAIPVELRTPAALVPYADEWRELVATAAWSSYFMTPDWVLSWWETHGGPDDLVALWPSADGGLDAVVGLARARHRLHPRLPVDVRPWTVLGSGPGAADHVGWVVRPERAADVREWLAARLGRSPLLLGAADPAWTVGDLLPGLEPVGASPCPRVDLGDGPLPTGSSKLRKQVRYDERRLADAGVVLTWQPPGEVDPRALDDLLRLHGERASDRDWATSFTADRRDLHLALLRRSARGRGPAAVVATQEDRVVGVLYGFRWRETVRLLPDRLGPRPGPAGPRHGAGGRPRCATPATRAAGSSTSCGAPRPTSTGSARRTASTPPGCGPAGPPAGCCGSSTRAVERRGGDGHASALRH